MIPEDLIYNQYFHPRIVKRFLRFFAIPDCVSSFGGFMIDLILRFMVDLILRSRIVLAILVDRYEYVRFTSREQFLHVIAFFLYVDWDIVV